MCVFLCACVSVCGHVYVCGRALVSLPRFFDASDLQCKCVGGRCGAAAAPDWMQTNEAESKIQLVGDMLPPRKRIRQTLGSWMISPSSIFLHAAPLSHLRSDVGLGVVDFMKSFEQSRINASYPTRISGAVETIISFVKM